MLHWERWECSLFEISVFFDFSLEEIKEESIIQASSKKNRQLGEGLREKKILFLRQEMPTDFDPSPMRPPLRALLFDFDGLIVDTEWPIYQAWSKTFRDHGHPLPLETFTKCIGTDFDTWSPKTHLENLTGAEINWPPLDAARAAPEAKLDGVLIEPMAPPGGLEVFVGVSRDPVFGHVMTFGLGGVHVELFKDVARRMLPVTPAMAREMMAEIRSAPLLTGIRGQAPRDMAALEALIVAVSDYVVGHSGRVEELDINPVWVGEEGQGALALDAVIVVRA